MAQVFVADGATEAMRVTAAMLERAGQAVSQGVLGGGLVLDVQVIDHELLVFSIAAPKFDGYEVFRGVRPLRPDAPLIVVSFGDTACMTDAVHRLAPPNAVDQAAEREVWEELVHLTAAALVADTGLTADGNVSDDEGAAIREIMLDSTSD